MENKNDDLVTKVYTFIGAVLIILIAMLIVMGISNDRLKEQERIEQEQTETENITIVRRNPRLY